MWCLRFPVEPGTLRSRVRECWYANAVDAFEAYAEIEAEVRVGSRPWAQLWSPRGNCEAECDAPARAGLAAARRMVETAWATSEP
jgi:hypothetical protein